VPDGTCHRGRLISIEGLNGVGKTHLTARLLARAATSDGVILLKEFSARTHTDASDLGRDLLHALLNAAHGDPFLRSGHPGAETLLLLAIKMFDYEAGCTIALAEGRTVIEGRSVHSIAVYQSLIACPSDDAAYEQARGILNLAADWRPLPDLTILITDDATTAVHRAETRDGNRYTGEQWQLHHRAAALFDRLAADDPHRITVLDRRQLSTDALIDQMAYLIGASRTACLDQPRGPGIAAAPCRQRCRLHPVAA
jgi:dTMP kinase